MSLENWIGIATLASAVLLTFLTAWLAYRRHDDDDGEGAHRLREVDDADRPSTRIMREIRDALADLTAVVRRSVTATEDLTKAIREQPAPYQGDHWRRSN